MRICCVIGLLLLCGAFAKGQGNIQPLQHGPNDTILVNAIINGNDTLPFIALPECLVVDKLPKKYRARMEQWTRLRNAVYVTYPYARAASFILKDVDTRLAGMPRKKDRKDYLARKEKELRAEFGDKLENLSVYQGKVLMKLIARETGSNCYDIIRQLKGGFSARFWQTVAFFFGSNLKSEYDLQEDRDIEVIVKEIESRQGRYF